MIYNKSLKSNQNNIDDLAGIHNLDFNGTFEGVMMFDSQNIENESSNQLQHSIHHDFENMKWMNQGNSSFFQIDADSSAHYRIPVFFVRITKSTGNKCPWPFKL